MDDLNVLTICNLFCSFVNHCLYSRIPQKGSKGLANFNFKDVMTNLEIRNFAYDTIAYCLFENHPDFGSFVYDYVRQGGTIEACVEAFLMEVSDKIDSSFRPKLHDEAMKLDGTYAELLKIYIRACDIIVDSIGVMYLFNIHAITEFTNIRDSYTLGFITLEECANKIADKVKEVLVRPSIHILDEVLKLVGLPRFDDCVDSRDVYLGR